MDTINQVGPFDACKAEKNKGVCETYRASIPYDNDPRKLQDGITRKKQKLEHLDSVMHLDITPGYFSRFCRHMHNLKLCIAKDYHRFRLFGAPHAPEDLEYG